MNTLPLDAAVKVVMSALPYQLLIQLFDEPELERRGEILEGLDVGVAGPLVDALSADQQVDLYRQLTAEGRARLLPKLNLPTRETLTSLMSYPPTSAGGIMTTEYVERAEHVDVRRSARSTSRRSATREGNGLRHLHPRARDQPAHTA